MSTRLFEFGAGPPLVLVPGIQGRWEYVQPTIDALATTFRVVTFALCGDPASGQPFVQTRGFDNYADQLLDAVAYVGGGRVVVCGISFGGLAAVRFASAHADQTAALVLASTPGPGWRLRPRHARYARWPRLLGPLFLAESPWRLRAEIREALPDPAARRRFVRWQLGTLIRAPLSVTAMATRARLIGDGAHALEAARVAAPTLIVTGEPRLDYVVPVSGTADYARLIPGARREIMAGTGHLGTITHPDEFARLVSTFASQHAQDRGARNSSPSRSEVA